MLSFRVLSLVHQNIPEYDYLIALYCHEELQDEIAEFYILFQYSNV